MDPEVELSKAIASLREAEEDRKALGSVGEIREMRKKFKLTCDNTKREVQKLDQQQKEPTGRLRSGKSIIRPRAIYSDGKWVNKGIDDAEESFADDEKEYIRKQISQIRKRSNPMISIKTEHIKYLVMDVFLNELKDIKSGKIKSEFHDRYFKSDKLDQKELQSEIRTSLFSNEQRDYISGLLQGAFKTTIKDANDDIKHSEINYVVIVMLYECITRIVKHVCDFRSTKEALKFIRKSSREASGIDADEED